MRKSIKTMVGIRVAVALLAVLLFSFVMTVNILSIEADQKTNAETTALLNRAQTAEAAHYRWSANLSNALYANTEFTGSMDPTTCVLGQWLYGEAGTDNEVVLSLRQQMEPLHKELHQSASTALSLKATSATEAQLYYQGTIQKNLTTLVGLLDQVVAEGTALNEQTAAQMRNTITFMHVTSIVGLALCLISLISLVLYVINKVLKPILFITAGSRPLQDGHLSLNLHYDANDELGDLSRTLEGSMKHIQGYVEDINRMMEQLSDGNFDVHTSAPFIGDFRSIEESIDSFTSNISRAFGHIQQAEQRVSGNAEQLSSSSQSLAQGATEQASSVEELSATVNEIATNAQKTAQATREAGQFVEQAGAQLGISVEYVAQLNTAMEKISTSSEEISKIIATIENIAFQTNILALNAAVEAARAGSAGKSFAVVADEVRTLASKSDEAAKATKELIEGSITAVAEGGQVVAKVTESLDKTSSIAENVTIKVDAVVEAVESQTTAISQVTEGIEQISSVTQSNSATSEQSAATAQELSDQSLLMNRLVRGFQLS